MSLHLFLALGIGRGGVGQRPAGHTRFPRHACIGAGTKCLVALNRVTPFSWPRALADDFSCPMTLGEAGVWPKTLAEDLSWSRAPSDFSWGKTQARNSGPRHWPGTLFSWGLPLPGGNKNWGTIRKLTPVGFEPTQLALVELESTPLDHSGKVSWTRVSQCPQ